MPQSVTSLEVSRPITNMAYKDLSPLRRNIRERVITIVGPNMAQQMRFNKSKKMAATILSRGEIFGFLKEQIEPSQPVELDELQQFLEAVMPQAARQSVHGPVLPETTFVLPGEGNRLDTAYVTLGTSSTDMIDMRNAAQRRIHEFYGLPVEKELIDTYWEEGNTPPAGYTIASFRSRDTDKVIDAVSFAIEAARADVPAEFVYGPVAVEQISLVR